jgi:DNA repair photolyase
VRVFVSLAFADETHARAVEPWASSVAPIIPGLNDDQAARVLALANEHGARRAFMQMLRLGRTEERLERLHPARRPTRGLPPRSTPAA